LLAKKLRTGLRVLAGQGPRAVWSILADKVVRTSRIRPGGSVHLEGCVFQADAHSRPWLLKGEYEGQERFASKHYIRRDIPVVELGGSIGVVACLLNRRLKNPAKHVVVEANPQILPRLLENRNRNHCRFEILHGAAGVVGDSIQLYLGENALSASAITIAPESVEVPAVRLTDILESRGFKRCAVVCDIEGAELELLRAEMDTFSSRVEVFIVEFHPGISGPESVEGARVLLKDHGFVETWHERDVYVYLNTGLVESAQTGLTSGRA